MAQHPLNLTVRFILEIAALAAMGYWGWGAADGAGRYLLAVGLPLLAAAAWGTFRVPGDPGKGLVPVPGTLRLLLEGIFFGFAAWALFAAGATTYAWIFTAVVLVHYALSYDRIGWLIRHE
ncbi:MAG: YrdB family protein [Caldilineaceae bacterium]|nr:YrdB family protein [Caldilineaceae bacterium]